MVQVILNQVVLGPYVITVVFAWNSLWQGKLDRLPALYFDRALPTLIDGKFEVPLIAVSSIMLKLLWARNSRWTV